jgi:hypothetical protein
MHMPETSKRTGFLQKACASVFMGVCAPVLVSMIVESLHTLGVNAHQGTGASAATVTQPNSPRDIFVNRGWGTTVAEARHDALRKALVQAAFQALDKPGSDAVLGAVCEGIIREPGSIILRYEDLRVQHEGTAATIYQCDVIVELARQPLLDRLRSARLQLKQG